MVCPSSAVVVARRHCQPSRIVKTARYITKGNGSSSDSGSGTDDCENNNSTSEHITSRQRVPFLSVPLTGKHLTTRWNIWRTSSSNNRCDECGKPLKNIPSSTRE